MEDTVHKNCTLTEQCHQFLLVRSCGVTGFARACDFTAREDLQIALTADPMVGTDMDKGCASS